MVNTYEDISAILVDAGFGIVRPGEPEDYTGDLQVAILYDGFDFSSQQTFYDRWEFRIYVRDDDAGVETELRRATRALALALRPALVAVDTLSVELEDGYRVMIVRYGNRGNPW